MCRKGEFPGLMCRGSFQGLCVGEGGKDTRTNEIVRCWNGNICGSFLMGVEDSRTHVLGGGGGGENSNFQDLLIECEVEIPWRMCRGHVDIPGPICMGVARYMGLCLGRVGEIPRPKFSSGR